MKRLYILFITFIMATPALSYDARDYVQPDLWSKHITASGIKASEEGITAGGANLKFGLTTRVKLRLSDVSDSNIYQYARARVSNMKLGSGHVNINLNLRAVWDNQRNKNPREYHVYYDGIDLSRGGSDLDFRLYQGNIEFNNVINGTKLQLGRLYLNTFDGYKIDGVNIEYKPFTFFNVYGFYGLPVSYYSNLNTQVAGGGLQIPIEASGTNIRASYSYFFHNDGGDYNTQVAKVRLDQNLFFTHLYGEGTMVGDAWLYEAGIDGAISWIGTNFSAYVMGQYDKNKSEVNPYVASFESELGIMSEYVMGGVLISQAITRHFMLGLGFEGKYNHNSNYGNRDYYRVFGTFDVIGLIHSNNFLSLIGDYYIVDADNRQDKNSKLMLGARMTQMINSQIDLWAGVNVMNYQYKNSPIKYYADQYEPGFTLIDQRQREENNTLAYIGGLWKPVSWCALQVDYTFEYSNLFKQYNLDNDNIHTVEVWVNFLW